MLAVINVDEFLYSHSSFLPSVNSNDFILLLPYLGAKRIPPHFYFPVVDAFVMPTKCLCKMTYKSC